MKTQINSLHNGSINLIGKDGAVYSENAYELGLRKSSGKPSTHKEREEIAHKVLSENGDTLAVEILGHQVSLVLHKSISGKSWHYRAEIDESLYKEIVPYTAHIGKDSAFSITIDHSCYVQMHVVHGKKGHSVYIDEAFINIL